MKNNINELKEQILKTLKKHPRGMRLRELAYILGVWNPYLVEPLAQLKAEGKVVAIDHHDPAQMEWYDIWKIK